MQVKRDSAIFADFLMETAHCKNLFDILENELSGINFDKLTEDDETTVFFWYQKFMKKLDHYIVMNAGKKALLMKYLIYSKLREEGTAKYIKIYKVLFH